MAPQNIPQSTIDKITEQIMAKFRPALDDAVSRAIAATAAEFTTAPKVLEVARIPAPDIGAAHWIWTHEAPHHNPPFGARAFRRVVIIPPGEFVDSMLVDVACNYASHIYVNGKVIGLAQLGRSERFSIKFPSTNHVVIAVSAIQQYGGNKHAGLIISAVFWDSTYYKGHTFAVNTDASWETSLTAVSADGGFVKPDYKPDSSWHPVRVEGPYGMAPWGNIAKPSKTTQVHTPTTSETYKSLNPFNVPLATNGPDAQYIL